MKKKQQNLKKLALNKRSIVALNGPELSQVQGGATPKTIHQGCAPVTSVQVPCPSPHCNLSYFCVDAL